ncbi:right-handed parallel beta-helix repeat-containing protein, partial [Pseudomonadota bacterium]
MTRIVFAVALLVVLNASDAADIYVSPEGRDSNAGDLTRPFASLEAARDKARGFAGKERVTIHVADGVYYLPETLVFSPKDSGTADAPVVYRAMNEGGAVLSGGSKLKLKWKAYRDGIFKADTPDGLAIDQLFVDGAIQRMARYPNYDASRKTEPYQGFSADSFSRERAALWADPAGGYIHAMHLRRWGGFHYRITGKDARGDVTYEGGWQNNRLDGMHDDFRMVENIFEELDAPGEWFHDGKLNTLYFMPEAGVDLNKAMVEGVRLRHLVEFRGSEADPVRYITLQGFVVRHAARTFMDTREPLLRSDWAIYRGGAFLLTGTEDVNILDCEFDQVGGNAIFVNKYNRRTRIKGCHIHDTGASGVAFVGDPDAVRNPLFEYNEVNDLSEIDRTPGPKTNNYPSDGVVADSLIHGIGRVERQPAGVQISMSMNITVRDTSIYDTARAGINVSEGTWGGHLIERVDVFDTVLETHDHGSFNSWGRDRFWRSDRDRSQQAVDADPALPFVDAMDVTVIRDSRWRCDHGWDIDLDDGSSNYDIYNNLMLGGGLKFREGFRRRAWNNIAVNSGFHPHVWFDNSNDEVHTNIFMKPHRDIRVNFKGQNVDNNLFFSTDPNILQTRGDLGWDANSILADPLF